MNSLLPKTLFSFIWHFLKPYKFAVSTFSFLAILTGFWMPFNNILIKNIVNLLPQIQAGDTSILTWPTLLIVLNFLVFDQIAWRLIEYINYKFQPVIKNQIIGETLNFVLNHSHEFFQDNLSGRISSQVTILAENIELILHKLSCDFIRGFSLLIVAFVTAYSVNPAFFYILFLWFIVFAPFSALMSKRLINLADRHASSETIISGQLVDCITNHSNVRIFSKKDYEISRMRSFFLTNQKAFQAKESFAIILHGIQGLMLAIMMGVTIYFLNYLYGKNVITIGDFALILGLSMELGFMIWHLMSHVDELNQAIGKCKQSLSALIIHPEIKNRIASQDLCVARGQIDFEEVQFQYKNSAPLFQNKSVMIEAGQKVGLVGYSGGGKSTFVNLILRLYEISSGRILIDGQDIREITEESLRRHIAMIPQDPSLFHRSLMENISYGKIDASDEAVLEASKKAHAHEFIVKLPQAYESLAGERGIKLSGGQRQRIAIARAILKNAPILILDEATSQLDSVTENNIQESLWELMKGKTTLVIAHRLSTLLHMDRILVFDEGKIVEDGTHTELLNKNGLYKILWNAQINGFLPDKKILNQEI